MINIQYFTHQLLNSKYLLYINLFLVFTFYSIFYGTKLIYCMNENTEGFSLPAIAETKEIQRPGHQLLAIKREIMSYAGSQVSFVERLDEQARIIEEQKTTICEMQKEITRLKQDVEIGKMHEREKYDLYLYKQQMDQYRNCLRHDISTAKRAVEWAERELNLMEECTERTEEIIKNSQNKFWDEYHKR